MRTIFRSTGAFLLVVALVMHTRTVAAQDATPAPCIVGIDHIPVAVKDLAAAEETYRKLGFSLKPGRPHQNGIRNAHVKFPDGAGIELITASEPTDALARHYVEHLKLGEGPADFSLHARDTARLVAALKAGGFDFEQKDGFVSLKDPQLSFLFFVRDNRSPTDRPEHFAHTNTAAAMVGVWLAPDDPDRLGKLLLALGATASRQTVLGPASLLRPTETTVYTVGNGRITVLPKECQERPGRPVVGAVFRTRDLAAVQDCLDRVGAWPTQTPEFPGQRRRLCPPRFARGIWLEFCEGP